MEAASKSDFFQEFKKGGDTLVSSQEVKTGRISGLLSLHITFLERVSSLEKIIFARNLGNMLGAGLALSRAINVTEKQTKNAKLKSTCKALNEAIASGKSFHEALQMHPAIFSPLFISMVKVGEEGGNLAENLKQVSVQMEKSYIIKKKVKGAMMYPGIILSVMVIIGILMMIYVVPSLTSTFTSMNVPLPTSTKLIIVVSNFAAAHYILVFVGLGAFVAAVFAFLRTKVGMRCTDFVILRLPVIKVIVAESNSAQTCRTLSSLLASGVDLLLAVKITGEVIQNSYYKNVLKKSEAIVEKGEPLSTLFVKEEWLYPLFVGEMMSVGEETGQVATMLAGVATFYENEVEQKTKDLSTIIEPVLMVFIGAGVGFFAISMIKPIYSIIDHIQ